MKPIDQTNPPSELTVMLHDAGWTWNEDWTWTDPTTGQVHRIRAAVRLANSTKGTKVTKVK